VAVRLGRKGTERHVVLLFGGFVVVGIIALLGLASVYELNAVVVFAAGVVMMMGLVAVVALALGHATTATVAVALVVVAVVAAAASLGMPLVVALLLR